MCEESIGARESLAEHANGLVSIEEVVELESASEPNVLLVRPERAPKTA